MDPSHSNLSSDNQNNGVELQNPIGDQSQLHHHHQHHGPRTKTKSKKPNKAYYEDLDDADDMDDLDYPTHPEHAFSYNNDDGNNTSTTHSSRASRSLSNSIENLENNNGYTYGEGSIKTRKELMEFQRVHSKIPPKLYMVILASFAAICGFLGGYDTGIISGATLYIREDFHLSDFTTELVVSGVIAGAVIGGLFSGPLADKWGRKGVLLFSAIVFIIGALLMGFAPNWEFLLVGRVIAGAAVGIGAIVPVYIGELAPKDVRGSFINFNSFYIALGQLVSYIVAYLLSGSIPGKNGGEPTGNWRLMLGLACVPACLQLVGIWIMPESPRFLVSRGKKLEACKVISLVRDRNLTSKDIIDEVLEIDASIIASKRLNSSSVSMKDIFTTKTYRNMLIIAAGLQILQQLSGINTIMYYSATILKMAGFSSKSQAILFSSFVGFANCIGTVIAMQLIDRCGRRPLLLYTIVGVFVSLCMMGGAFHVLEGNPAKSPDGTTKIAPMSWVTLITLIIYILFYATGLGCVPWTVLGEIFPLEVRGKGAGLAIAGNWFSNFIISMTFLTLTRIISPAFTFLIYAGFVFIGWFFVFFKVPETKGKSLESLGNSESIAFAH